jgi:predicted permease
MFQNIRLAFRSMWQRPALSSVIIAMLAVGIGSSTALFSMFYQILVQPLPVPEPQRLVNLSTSGPKFGSTSCGLAGGCDYVFSYPMFRDLETQQTAFAGIAAHISFRPNLGYADQTTSGPGMLVSGQYFSVLNVRPALGRLIGPQDEPKLDEAGVVVLSHEYWKTRFGGDPEILNKTLTVNGQQLTIIGVAPEDFSGAIIGLRPQVYVPLTLSWRLRPAAPKNYDDRRAYWLYVFARLKPNVNEQATAAAINSLYGGIIRQVDAPLNGNLKDDAKQKFLDQKISLNPGARGFTSVNDSTGQALTILFSLTALVLLIVCVNVANLLLARAAARAGEMAIRVSIGASRRQLMAQLLTESSLLAVIGGVLSLPVAASTLNAITAILPDQTSSQLALQISPTAMAFAAAAALFSLFLFGVFPALHGTRTSPALTIKEQAPQLSNGRGMARFRVSLVTAQIALSTVLLVLAGLFAQSLKNISRVKLGMQLDSLVSFTVAPRSNGYSPERTRAMFDRIEEELAAQPGVTGVTSASIPLLTGASTGNSITIDGFEPGGAIDTTVRRNEVSPSFFKTLSIPLVMGRGLTDADTLEAPKVAVVNESFVRKFKLGDNAIGKHFSGFPYDNVTKIDVEIVGVVADAAYNSVKGGIPAQYYQPRRQSERPNALAFYVRSANEPASLMRAIPRVVSDIDHNLPVNNLITMRRQMRDNTYVDVFVAILSAAFAGLATFLAAVGLYGVLAYNVAQRTREFGLRSALGANPGKLRAMVLKQVGLMALIGGVIGLAAAVTLGRTAEALLFGLSGHDAWVLTGAAIVLAAVVLLAGYLPARRASNTAPMEALRYQ